MKNIVSEEVLTIKEIMGVSTKSLLIEQPLRFMDDAASAWGNVNFTKKTKKKATGSFPEKWEVELFNSKGVLTKKIEMKPSVYRNVDEMIIDPQLISKHRNNNETMSVFWDVVDHLATDGDLTKKPEIYYNAVIESRLAKDPKMNEELILNQIIEGTQADAKGQKLTVKEYMQKYLGIDPHIAESAAETATNKIQLLKIGDLELDKTTGLLRRKQSPLDELEGIVGYTDDEIRAIVEARRIQILNEAKKNMFNKQFWKNLGLDIKDGWDKISSGAYWDFVIKRLLDYRNWLKKTTKVFNDILEEGPEIYDQCKRALLTLRDCKNAEACKQAEEVVLIQFEKLYRSKTRISKQMDNIITALENSSYSVDKNLAARLKQIKQDRTLDDWTKIIKFGDELGWGSKFLRTSVDSIKAGWTLPRMMGGAVKSAIKLWKKVKTKVADEQVKESARAAAEEFAKKFVNRLVTGSERGLPWEKFEFFPEKVPVPNQPKNYTVISRWNKERDYGKGWAFYGWLLENAVNKGQWLAYAFLFEAAVTAWRSIFPEFSDSKQMNCIDEIAKGIYDYGKSVGKEGQIFEDDQIYQLLVGKFDDKKNSTDYYQLIPDCLTTTFKEEEINNLVEALDYLLTEGETAKPYVGSPIVKRFYYTDELKEIFDYYFDFSEIDPTRLSPPVADDWYFDFPEWLSKQTEPWNISGIQELNTKIDTPTPFRPKTSEELMKDFVDKKDPKWEIVKYLKSNDGDVALVKENYSGGLVRYRCWKKATMSTSGFAVTPCVGELIELKKTKDSEIPQTTTPEQTARLTKIAKALEKLS